jgi:hypothetical protein
MLGDGGLSKLVFSVLGDNGLCNLELNVIKQLLSVYKSPEM